MKAPVLQEDGGSLPTPPLHVCEIPLSIARPFIELWHYSKKSPTGKNVFFGWFAGSHIYAVADYGIGVNQAQERYLARVTEKPVTKTNLYELKRLCRIEPRLPNVQLTQFLTHCHKLLKKRGIRFIVSFSDPTHNEFTQKTGKPYDSGGIYKAANFRYLGKTNPEWHVEDKDGVQHHRRVAYRHMQRENSQRLKNGNLEMMTLNEARELLGFKRVCTKAKDRWFLDLGEAR